ncbi:MAG: hypothetical protein IPK82_41610 [Polyangiaceae bacterium]|nr:hypothetical protein [Polyangiaceae bacterium]
MSAVAAVFHRDRARVDPALVTALLQAPPAQGAQRPRVWSQGEAALGVRLFHARKSSDDGLFFERDLAVALTGRIDNRSEIARLCKANRSLETDAEHVAAAYRAFGVAFAEHLVGDFAVVIWDGHLRELILARDPLGARSLFYFEKRGEVHVASQIEALLTSPAAPPHAVRFDNVALLLAERYVEDHGPLLADISSVLPGETVRIGAGVDRHQKKVWPIAKPLLALSESDAADLFFDTLKTAVMRRMRGAERVAVHVSGGLDSSSIAVLAAHVANENGQAPPVLVRCVFPGLSCDESTFSQAVADHLRLPISSVALPGDLNAYTPSAAASKAALTNPFSEMLAGQIAAAAAQGVHTTLTGAGSDQLLQPTGYELADALLRRDASAVSEWSGLRETPFSRAPAKKILRMGFGRIWPDSLRSLGRALVGRRVHMPEWMTKTAQSAVRRYLVPPLGGRDFASFPSLSSRRLATQLIWDPDYRYSIALANAVGAAHSAELCHPFFDRDVIDLLLQFQAEQRSPTRPPKLLLRRAMRRLLPQVIALRESVAEFSPFVRAALIEPHGAEIERLLQNGRLADLGLIEPKSVTLIVQQARSGDNFVLRDVVSLTSVETYLRRILG